MRSIKPLLRFSVILVAVLVSRADDKKPESPAGITLTLGVVESKADKKLVFRSILKNGSDKAITLPDAYDGKTISLRGKGEGHRWELRLYSRMLKKHGTVSVKAGEERIVFELPVDDILFDPITGAAETSKSKWGWDWIARPASPPTPFHQSDRNNRLLRQANFWVEVNLAGRPIASKPVRLELRLGVVPVAESK